MTDVLQIMALLAAFGLNADLRDWDAVRKVFASEVFVDYSSLFGGSGQTTKSVDLVRSWQGLLPGFTRTQHTIGVPLVTPDGNRAHATAPFVAYHFIDDPAPAGGDVWIVGGRYEWSLEKTEDRWRITRLVLAQGWQHGNRDLPKLAAERAARVTT